MPRENIYKYMSDLQIDGVAPWVDALTVTATGLEGKLSIAIVLENLREEIEIEPLSKFNYMGAKGWARGSVRYADKWDERGQRQWAILMVTGKSSEVALKTALRVGSLNFTRVDLAVDVKMRERVLGLARKLKDGYKGKKETKLIESLTGDTFYCGSRESDLMLRIYDKSEEYGFGQGFVWRFEAEFKGSRAERVASYVAMQGLSGIPDLVWTAQNSSDLPSPYLGQVVDIRGSKVTLTSSERKLAWLGNQVRPTVAWLIKLGKEKEVYEQLGLLGKGEVLTS